MSFEAPLDAYVRSHLQSEDRKIAANLSFLATHNCVQVERLLASQIQHRIEFLAFIRRYKSSKRET